MLYLYNIYLLDLPIIIPTTLASYTYDTTILASKKDLNIAAHNIQYHLNLIYIWIKEK